MYLKNMAINKQFFYGFPLSSRKYMKIIKTGSWKISTVLKTNTELPFLRYKKSHMPNTSKMNI